MNASRIFATWVWIALTLLLVSGCDRQGSEARKVSLADTVTQEKEVTPEATGNQLRVAVAAILSPQASFTAYRDMLAYLERRLSMPVHLVQRRTYKEVNELLGENRLDMAFVCTGAYVIEGSKHGMELLVAPVVQGEPVYYSYVITRQGTGIERFTDLEGKSFAFSDPLSNTGYFAPRCMLGDRKKNPDRFFSRTIFTHSHDGSVEAVAKGLVDGAAVDSLVFDALAESEPDLVRELRIIERSAPFGIPPVVVSRAVEQETRDRLRNLLLGMHEDPEGKKILSSLRIDRFVKVDDSLYDSVRDMYEKMDIAGMDAE
ncbi:MAG: phosphate/phosphite/phosphonate ABC transporter substrate-binding protein [Desulfobulbaceae bacterium]